ncbi:MAG: DUF4469 domain-containing protein [Leptospiraceae bacterium]|nr:DUF4469 domain-containing protein [Leptospiraceae bacterium]MBL0263402.1 DUF4469 domain-containing protein [Leptospiraceae bacterium]
MVKFQVVKNKLGTEGKAPYLPRTLLEGSLDIRNVIKALAYGSTATPPDVLAVLENLERVCIENLSQGRSVNLGFCILRPKVKGVFQNPEEAFSEDKHSVEVSIVPSQMFVKRVAIEAKTVRVAQGKILPLVISVENISSGAVDTLSSGDLVAIRGENLKFNKAELNQGVFLEKNGAEIRVSEYSQVTSKLVSFKTPNGIVIGESYRLRVRNLFGSEIRTGEMEQDVKAA